MRIAATSLPGVLLVEPQAFGDERGYFMETFSASRYAESGIAGPFVQDNLSRSRRGVLRGIHFQHPYAQAKLVSVLEGEVFDVAVDLRVGSPTFGRWHAELLSAENRRQLFVPEGFGHAFAVTSDRALFSYKCTEYYHPECERTIRWDDARIGIAWPMADVELSTKDRAGLALDALSHDSLPRYTG